MLLITVDICQAANGTCSCTGIQSPKVFHPDMRKDIDECIRAALALKGHRAFVFLQSVFIASWQSLLATMRFFWRCYSI